MAISSPVHSAAAATSRSLILPPARLAKRLRNYRWLSKQPEPWFEPLVGKWVAAAAGEAFADDDPNIARQLALAAHPNDEPHLEHILSICPTSSGRLFVVTEPLAEPDRVH